MAKCRLPRAWSYLWLFLTVITVWLVLQTGTSLFSRRLCRRAASNDLQGTRDELGRIRSENSPLRGVGGEDTHVSKLKDALTSKHCNGDCTESYETPIRPLKLVSGFGSSIALFSAIAGNSTADSTWDKIAISGWEASGLNNQTYVCCVAYSSGAIKSFPATKLSRGSMVPMKSRQYICALNETNTKDLPVAATIADATKPICHIYTATYVVVEYAYKHPGEVAIFGKIIYGNVSAYDLVTWITIHRLQGVDKFLIYPYELSTAAVKVLRYYERQGFLEVIPYSRHTQAPFESVGLLQTYNDQEVTEYDGLERLRGYDYLVNFDMDEYILSRKGETWKELFNRLFKSTQDGGAFWFQSYIFVKSWGPTNASCPFSVGRYTIRTNITSNTQKLVVIPSKIKDSGLSTHYSNLIEGYNTHMVNHEDAAIHHFRQCRREWLEKDSTFPCYNITRNHDTTVLKLFNSVEKDVIDVITELGI